MNIRVTKLSIKNVGKISDSTIDINKPLLLFYGEVRAGKSTILNAIRWVFGGSFPSDIIRHGAQEASVCLEFTGGSITREWYKGVDGETRSRDIKFIREGQMVKKPFAEIQRFLNPFLLNQNHLVDMGETDRKRYFAELFQVDTKALDAEAVAIDHEASQLRAVIKGYGDIDLTEHKRVDVAALEAKRAKIIGATRESSDVATREIKQILDAYNETVIEIDEANAEAIRHNSQVARGQEVLTELDKKILELKRALQEAEDKHAATRKWLHDHPVLAIKPRPAAPDVSALRKQENAPPPTSEIDAQISAAGAQNVRAEQFEKNKERDAARKKDQKALAAKDARLREIKAEKIAKLKTISESSGVPGLTFDEDGVFTYQGTQAGMLSTSQLMELSSRLSALYPDGFGIDLIDRGESLGKSIFDYVERAKAEEKTILATIVGEHPAKVPADVGVFVVDDGKVEAK